MVGHTSTNVSENVSIVLQMLTMLRFPTSRSLNPFPRIANFLMEIRMSHNFSNGFLQSLLLQQTNVDPEPVTDPNPDSAPAATPPTETQLSMESLDAYPNTFHSSDTSITI